MAKAALHDYRETVDLLIEKNEEEYINTVLNLIEDNVMYALVSVQDALEKDSEIIRIPKGTPREKRMLKAAQEDISRTHQEVLEYKKLVNSSSNSEIRGGSVCLITPQKVYYGEFNEDGTIYEWEGTRFKDIEPSEVLKPDSLTAYNVTKDYLQTWDTKEPTSEEITKNGCTFHIIVYPLTENDLYE